MGHLRLMYEGISKIMGLFELSNDTYIHLFQNVKVIFV